MYTINLRHQFGIHWSKVILVILLGIGFSNKSFSQGMNFGKLNLPNYDERWLHYGFLIGGHTSNFRFKYNDAFATAKFDSLHSVITPGSAGFKIGFVADFKLYEFLSLRISGPTVGFYENSLKYRFTAGGEPIKETKDATLVELPILFKYKSVRRKNNRMYLLAGLNPIIEAAGSKDENDNVERLETKNFNVNLELGVGTDIFYEFFKFALELRYSRNLFNLLENRPNIFNAPLNRLTIHNIAFFITFEGGPS